MATLTDFLSTSQAAGRLRPFDARRDLNRVADLVEDCFADTLDREGRHYLRQMRAAANSPGYLRWAGIMAERASLPLTGYVWEEDDILAGNLTLIPYANWGYRYYLIANVAVHQDFRRRGIARMLTQAAIEHARRRKAQAVWLHVRAENQAAQSLYLSQEFVERARRNTWQYIDEIASLATGKSSAPPPSNSSVHIGARRRSDWNLQRKWLQDAYPAELTWHLALSLTNLQPGLWGAFHRLFNDLLIEHWVARRGDRLAGVISWQSSRGFADHLWLAVGDEGDDETVFALLRRVRDQLKGRRPMNLDYPAGVAEAAIANTGFRKQQTLVWMERRLD
jgi:ribosomal-protein-alanine N-acetyltransferase